MRFRFFFRVIVLGGLAAVGWLYLAQTADRLDAALEGCRVTGVEDAETLTLTCEGEGEVQARIAGIDVPDYHSPDCEAEMAHGALAVDRLRALMAEDLPELSRVGGYTVKTLRIRLSVDGEDVAGRLIREGLAVEKTDGAEVNWCDRLKVDGAGNGPEP